MDGGSGVVRGVAGRGPVSDCPPALGRHPLPGDGRGPPPGVDPGALPGSGPGPAAGDGSAPGPASGDGPVPGPVSGDGPGPGPASGDGPVPGPATGDGPAPGPGPGGVPGNVAVSGPGPTSGRAPAPGWTAGPGSGPGGPIAVGGAVSRPVVIGRTTWVTAIAATIRPTQASPSAARRRAPGRTRRVPGRPDRDVDGPGDRPDRAAAGPSSWLRVTRRWRWFADRRPSCRPRYSSTGPPSHRASECGIPHRRGRTPFNPRTGDEATVPATNGDLPTASGDPLTCEDRALVRMAQPRRAGRGTTGRTGTAAGRSRAARPGRARRPARGTSPGRCPREGTRGGRRTGRPSPGASTAGGSA